MRFANLGGNGNNYVAAAQGANSGLQDVFAKTRTDHAGLANLSHRSNANERIAGTKLMADFQNLGINSFTDALKGKYAAKVIEAQAAANASTANSAGVSSLVQGIGGGILDGLADRSNWEDATDIGFPGNQVDANGRLRY